MKWKMMAAFNKVKQNKMVNVALIFKRLTSLVTVTFYKCKRLI